MVTIASMVLIACLIGLGYLRGAVRLGATFVALVVASLLASPLSALTAWAVRAAGIPRLLVPSLAALASGLCLFFLLGGLALAWVKRRWGDHRPSWDAPVGAVVGGVWGLTLVLLTLTGLATIGRVDRAMRVGSAEASLRAEARQRFEREADADLRPLRTSMTPQRYEKEKQQLVSQAEQTFYLEPAKVRERAGAGSLDTFLVELEHSPFEGAVDKVSPVTIDTEKALRDLAIVVGSPHLFEKFCAHPTVQHLREDPHLLTLSNDPEIAQAVIAGRYRELLDHPKMIEAVENPVVREKFAKVNISEILEDVRGGEGS